MPSDAALQTVDWSSRTEPADLPEWMDEPCSYEELRACLHDLGHVNRISLGYKPTLSFLDQIAARNPQKTPLRILDVGSGGGDALNRIAYWANGRGIVVHLTGIDLNPFATAAARERFGEADTQWLSGDALACGVEADVVVSSLLTHHLPTTGIVEFLQWMERSAHLGWFINDLERSSRSASLYALLARAMHWHRFVQHDGPVSFARSFVREDWTRMLAEAGVSQDSVQITQHFPSRLCVSRFK